MARRAAKEALRRLPSNVEFDDLHSVALTAAWQAQVRYQPDRGASLETYLYERAQGAVLDLLRQEDRLSRKTRVKLKQLQLARWRFEQFHSREPSLSELSARLGLSLEAVDSLLQLEQCGAERELDIDTLYDALLPSSWAVDAAMERLDAIAITSEVLAKASSAEKVVVECLLSGRTLSDAADELTVSLSRACQIATALCSRIQAAHAKAAEPRPTHRPAQAVSPSPENGRAHETYYRLELAIRAQATKMQADQLP